MAIGAFAQGCGVIEPHGGPFGCQVAGVAFLGRAQVVARLALGSCAIVAVGTAGGDKAVIKGKRFPRGGRMALGAVFAGWRVGCAAPLGAFVVVTPDAGDGRARQLPVDMAGVAFLLGMLTAERESGGRVVKSLGNRLLSVGGASQSKTDQKHERNQNSCQRGVHALGQALWQGPDRAREWAHNPTFCIDLAVQAMHLCSFGSDRPLAAPKPRSR